MIDLYYWPTPNCHKVALLLEETGLAYQLKRVNIGEGEQFAAGFARISPNNKVPVIVDQDPADGGEAWAVFESGAILEYLAEKTSRFLPRHGRQRYEVLQWLTWQLAGLGPTAAQNLHFGRFASDRIPYAIDRYVDETRRLYGVLDRHLTDRDFIAGEYSIADIACYPWIVPWQAQQQDLQQFDHLRAWFERIAQRPAVARAYALADTPNSS